jgi:hypothetical protein
VGSFEGGKINQHMPVERDVVVKCHLAVNPAFSMFHCHCCPPPFDQQTDAEIRSNSRGQQQSLILHSNFARDNHMDNSFSKFSFAPQFHCSQRRPLCGTASRGCLYLIHSLDGIQTSFVSETRWTSILMKTMLT